MKRSTDPAASYLEVLAHVQQGACASVYLVVGAEAILREELVSAVRRVALGSGLVDFNVDLFAAGETDILKVLDAAHTTPLFAPRRLVLVKHLERWDTPGEASGKSLLGSPLDRLADYLEHPSPTTCLLLTASKLDGRKRLVSSAKKHGFWVPCDPLDAVALRGWITARCTAKGHAMAQDAMDLLVECVGNNLGLLDEALERLSLYVGEAAPLSRDAVLACVARVQGPEVWALVDAVLEQNLSKALQVLHEVYDPKDRGLPLLGALAWAVRQLARFQAWMEKGGSSDEAARAAGVFHPARARELTQRARAFAPHTMATWLLVLADTDRALKGSRKPSDTLLAEMLTRLVCG